MFRVGYRTASFSHMPLEDALAALGRLGYDSVELCLERADLLPITLDRAKAFSVVDAAERSGLRIHSISFHGDGVDWPRRAAEQRAAVESAQWFGVEVVVVNTPRRSEGVEDKELVDHIASLGELAQTKGVLLAVEPEPELMVADVADVLRLIDRLGNDAIGVNLDIGHAFITEGSVTQAVHALQGRIFHVHLEDISDDVHQHLVPGEGDINLPEVLCSLWDAGYRGVLTIDLFGPYEDPTGVAQRALRASRDVIRRAMASARRLSG